jgi:hypothetical protein
MYLIGKQANTQEWRKNEVYLLAKVRGLLPENHKGTFVFGKPDKKIIKEMYGGGNIPYRIDTMVSYK